MKHIDSLALDYILNKFAPYLIIFILLFTNFSLSEFSPWIICGCIFFIDKFAFRIGRSVGEYENNPKFKQSVDEQVEDE